MNYRDVVIFSGHQLQVPEHIQRLDSKKIRAWQLRYGKWKTFSDHTTDGSGAEDALAEAIKELNKRINSLPAPTGLKQRNSTSKNNDLPVGISGPISRTRKGRRVVEYGFGVTIPRFGDKPTTANVYIGNENTFTDERYDMALAKAVDIRKKAVRVFEAAKTKDKRATMRTKESN